jgi:hypothetical protein
MIGFFGVDGFVKEGGNGESTSGDGQTSIM